MDSRNDRKIEWTVVRDFTQDVEVPAHNPSYPPRKLTLVVRVSKADNEFVPPTIQHGKLVADRVTSFIPVSYYVRDGQVHFINTKEILQNLQHQALEYCKDLITMYEAKRKEERTAREQRGSNRDKPAQPMGLKKLGKRDYERRLKSSLE